MAKTEQNKKVPGALIAAVAVVVAIAVFVPTVYLPYKDKKPRMDAAHQEAVDTIEFYDSSIANQDVIEADIASLTAQWEKYQKEMFVNADAVLKDLNTAIKDYEIDVGTFNVSPSEADPSGTVTSEGNPLYFTRVNITCNAEREEILKFLDYVEKESIGCYYIRTFNASPFDVLDSDGSDVIGEEFNVQMEIVLYYFNQEITVAPEVVDTEAAEGA